MDYFHKILKVFTNISKFENFYATKTYNVLKIGQDVVVS